MISDQILNSVMKMVEKGNAKFARSATEKSITGVANKLINSQNKKFTIGGGLLIAGGGVIIASIIVSLFKLWESPRIVIKQFIDEFQKNLVIKAGKVIKQIDFSRTRETSEFFFFYTQTYLMQQVLKKILTFIQKPQLSKLTANSLGLTEEQFLDMKETLESIKFGDKKYILGTLSGVYMGINDALDKMKKGVESDPMGFQKINTAESMISEKMITELTADFFKELAKLKDVKSEKAVRI